MNDTKTELNPMRCAEAASQWLLGDSNWAHDAFACDTASEANATLMYDGAGGYGGILWRIAHATPAEAERIARVECEDEFDGIYDSLNSGN